VRPVGPEGQGLALPQLASVVNLLNPDTIVLGGAAGELAGPFITGALRRELRAWALPVPVAAARVVPGSLGEDVATIGAAALALECAPLVLVK
jgi:predicted NBD/HSP70 family sugar kinase